MADNKFKSLTKEQGDKPNLELFLEGAKVHTPEAPETLNKIHTYGNVDSRRTPTRNKNVKIKQSVYDFIDAYTDGDQNVTLILNHLLDLGVMQVLKELVDNDVDIKGA